MTQNTTTLDNQRQAGFSRRGFLAGTAAIGLTIIQPERVTGTQANAKIKLGLVGCGGRGNWIADLFVQHGGYEFVGTADYFADRAAGSANRLKVPVAQSFSGLSGYKRLLDTKPDAIVIESPPYFHPEQSLAGVNAGCHVYCAKPTAVDVPGCLTIAEAGRLGTAKQRCVLIDFQTRANEFYREAIRLVHEGDIGPVVSAEAVYYCGGTWGGNETLAADPQNPEHRLRAWGLDRVLSGDVITEQNIHALDVATWVVNQDPVKAVGTCGKKGRQDVGTCHDHFAVIYTFPNDVVVSFASKQYGTGYDDIGCRAYGPKGTFDSHYFGLVRNIGEKSYKGGKLGNLYTEGAVQNIADFHANITKGNHANATVAPSVRSNLTTILGRLAAYKKAEVTWDEMLKTAEKLEFPTAGLKS
ncbi:MAG: Gfo/Idh/MocA family oxidoreductase [Planctomycetota bacterium]|nr:Gfo/Idh/MocA family oxidoreductase [Planctomycetota bacterium]